MKKIIGKNITLINKNTKILNDYGLGELISDFDSGFRGEIKNIIDLLDGNFIIKTDKYFYVKLKENKYFRIDTQCFSRIQDAIAYIYSPTHYSAIITLFDNN